MRCKCCTARMRLIAEPGWLVGQRFCGVCVCVLQIWLNNPSLSLKLCHCFICLSGNTHTPTRALNLSAPPFFPSVSPQHTKSTNRSKYSSLFFSPLINTKFCFPSNATHKCWFIHFCYESVHHYNRRTEWILTIRSVKSNTQLWGMWESCISMRWGIRISKEHCSVFKTLSFWSALNVWSPLRKMCRLFFKPNKSSVSSV